MMRMSDDEDNDAGRITKGNLNANFDFQLMLLKMRSCQFHDPLDKSFSIIFAPVELLQQRGVIS